MGSRGKRGDGGNTDTMLRPHDFETNNIIRAIAIREVVCGDAFMGFLGHLPQVACGGLNTNISELQDLMRRRRIYRKAGTIGDRILKVLMYGKGRKYEPPPTPATPQQKLKI